MDTSQRIKLFIWKCLQDALPTRQKLRSVDNKCVFCNDAVESTYHLFFHCDYAKAVWNLPPMALQGAPVNISFLHRYNNWIAGDLNSISMVLATTKCLFIWKEMCLKFFEDKSRTPDQLTLDITRHYAYWHPTKLNSLSEPQCRTIKPTPHWQFLLINIFKLNFDASWLSKNTNAGFDLSFVTGQEPSRKQNQASSELPQLKKQKL
ncbi:uncharacterized protein LOC113305871 [Papaver somniferum]|uniref:uncharacterized protein LOC113305871 n=1 Tax=Papaver somniferum TaxID=3469 RepID=UPI000E6FA06E|nr:uncharacterized protein LOC113305871 [Papaver somniferum]